MKCLSPEKAFLGLEAVDAVRYDQAKAVIIPFGLESSVSYGGGTSKGPQAIIEASHEVELFDEQFWCEPFRKIGMVTLESPFDDLEDRYAHSQEERLNQLETLVKQVLEDGKFPLTLGGEHSITAGAIKPFAEKYPDLVILHFDAHADLRDGYEGNPYSHASALRRCLDNPNLQLVSLGIRNISAEEIPFLEDNRHRIHIYWAKDKKHWNKDEILAHLKGRRVYLTFDLDGFDASLMPATGTPEPGGLFWDEVTDIIQAAGECSRIVGADVNELAPIPGLHSCDFLAAKLTYKILTYALLK